jgi:menaquinone-dependent protoporphyrinogen oxidase
VPALILYSTKYGTAKKYAESIVNRIRENIEIKDLDNQKDIDLTPYDTVIIIASVYAGNVKKQVKQFCSSHLDRLMEKKLGLAICCWMEGEEAEKQLAAAYPKELLSHAAIAIPLGGEMILNRLGFFECLVVRLIAKQKSNISHFDETKAKEIILALKL